MTTAAVSRRLLFALATSERLEAGVRRAPALERAAWGRASRYVAGERLEDAASLVAKLHDDGVRASVDLFGEAVTDPAIAEAVAADYVELARRLRQIGGDATLALDLSHVGLDVSAALCRRQLDRIAAACEGRVRMDIGAEDTARTDAGLAVATELARAGAPVQMTVQANLRRSPGDWPGLAEAGAGIRLVKGAYVERAAAALPHGEPTDVAYLRLAHAIHRGGARLALATHDPVLREGLLESLGRVDVEMLLGVRPQDARELAARGISVRLYVPYGANWFRYWMRRVAESRGA